MIATTQTKPSDQPFSPVGAFDGMPSTGIIGTKVHTFSTLASVKQMVVLSVPGERGSPEMNVASPQLLCPSATTLRAPPHSMDQQTSSPGEFSSPTTSSDNTTTTADMSSTTSLTATSSNDHLPPQPPDISSALSEMSMPSPQLPFSKMPEKASTISTDGRSILDSLAKQEKPHPTPASSVEASNRLPLQVAPSSHL